MGSQVNSGIIWAEEKRKAQGMMLCSKKAPGCRVRTPGLTVTREPVRKGPGWQRERCSFHEGAQWPAGRESSTVSSSLPPTSAEGHVFH